jgi:hypothetical protein
MGFHAKALAMASEGFSCDDVFHGAIETLGRLRHGMFWACKERFKIFLRRRLGVLAWRRGGAGRFRSALIGVIPGFDMQGNSTSSRRRFGHGGQLYNLGESLPGLSSGLVGSYTGGGVNKGNPVRTPPT